MKSTTGRARPDWECRRRGVGSGLLAAFLLLAAGARANTPPVAREQNVLLVRGQSRYVFASFSDPDPTNSLTFQIVAQPANGRVSVWSRGFYYTPDNTFTGTDTFQWRVSDGTDESNIASCQVRVRAPADRAGALVLLLLKSPLFPELEPELRRLEADLQYEGYTARIVTNSWSSADQVWTALKAEYFSAGQYLEGAILIGDMPLARGATEGQYTDCVYMNLGTDYRDTLYRQIWVSRMFASWDCSRFGSEVTLLKRAFDANHAYRTGASRLPHTAYNGGQGEFDYHNSETTNALEVWPAAITMNSPLDAFSKGAELMQETSHGSSERYWWSSIHTYEMHHGLVQCRAAMVDSCGSGKPGGVVNNQLLTRGGGNVLSVGASITTYDTYFNVLQAYGTDRNYRARLAAGDSWGGALIDHYFPSDNQRAIFYGDLSLPAMAAPSNDMPGITAFEADSITGAVPITINYTLSASDPDGSVDRTEWWLLGYDYGRVEPDAAGPAVFTHSYTYTLPHRYRVRVEAVDSYGARAYRELSLKLAPAPGAPLRVNCGRIRWCDKRNTYVDSGYYVPGYDYTDDIGRLWLQDQKYGEGTWGFTGTCEPRYNAGEVTGTEDDAVYGRYMLDTSRTGFTYSVPLQDGRYSVTLGFADMKNNGAGMRLLNAGLEGQDVLTDFDVVAAAGHDTAVSVTRHVRVEDGMLDIRIWTSAASPAGEDGCAMLSCFVVEPAPEGMPLAAAGPDQLLLDEDGDGTEAVTLDASGSLDENHTIVAWVWSTNGVPLAAGRTARVPLPVGRTVVALTVTDDEGLQDTDYLVIRVNGGFDGGMAPFNWVAYNDLSWTAGQSDDRITRYTTGSGEGMPPDGTSGPLRDFRTGDPVAATLRVTGGSYSDSVAGQGRMPADGTEADGIFGGILTGTGVISYGDPVVLQFSGLAADARYVVALFGNRDNPDYTDRVSRFTIGGAAAFENRSSAGAGFNGSADASVVITNGYNTPDGYVARFANVDPGADGAFTVTVDDGGSANAPKHYVNALMLAAYGAGDGTGGSSNVVVTARGATWKYRAGTTEASGPVDAWRAAAFDDSGWLSGPAPVGYSGYADPIGSELPDMQYSYTTFFMRREFGVADPALVSTLTFSAAYDDGFVLWLNGRELARVNVDGAPGDPLAHDQTAASNCNSTWQRTFIGAELPLLRTTNVLAVQAFNVGLASGDCFLDLDLSLQEGSVFTTDADGDQDGIHDDWEAAEYGGAAVWGGHDDPDGDGLDNIGEFIAGTGATNPASFLAVGVTLRNGAILVSVPTIEASGTAYAGLRRCYALECRPPQPGTPVWTVVPGCAGVVGTGQPLVFTNSVPADGQYWYRARVWLEESD
ncbi:MAG: hypothetical protein JXR37_32605 [Kiritimatiellae bacterium]|nr:hypothetical protein [Kiritimatiellia bacterium]